MLFCYMSKPKKMLLTHVPNSINPAFALYSTTTQLNSTPTQLNFKKTLTQLHLSPTSISASNQPQPEPQYDMAVT